MAEEEEVVEASAISAAMRGGARDVVWYRRVIRGAPSGSGLGDGGG